MNKETAKKVDDITDAIEHYKSRVKYMQDAFDLAKALPPSTEGIISSTTELGDNNFNFVIPKQILLDSMREQITGDIIFLIEKRAELAAL